MRGHKATKVHLVLPEAALTQVFDECDRFDPNETGGRIVGRYAIDPAGVLAIRVTGLIEAGPRAVRSPVSLFQDGDYQERVFRILERFDPDVEHLGNWHTHHVNGLRCLSFGDLATYYRTVNHPRHNPPFFYALLVTEKREGKQPLRRYNVQHYLFRRGDRRFCVIPKRRVQLVREPLVWPPPSAGLPERQRSNAGSCPAPRPEAQGSQSGATDISLSADVDPEPAPDGDQSTGKAGTTAG
jgi:hypothetical protein